MPRMNIKGPVPKAARARQDRFVARFVNGIHTVFDRETFKHGPALGAAKQASETARDLNEGNLQWAS
jgi:hypothetical protein